MSEVNTLYAESDRLKDEGKIDEAIEKLQQVLAIDPNHVLTHLALAVLYGRVDKHDLAIEHGEKACQLEPTEAFNFTAMSVTYQRAWQGTQKQEYITLAESARDRAHAIQGGAG